MIIALALVSVPLLATTRRVAVGLHSRARAMAALRAAAVASTGSVS
jgi:hypothetical protein